MFVSRIPHRAVEPNSYQYTEHGKCNKMHRDRRISKLRIGFRQGIEEQEYKKADRLKQADPGNKKEGRMADPVGFALIADGA